MPALALIAGLGAKQSHATAIALILPLCLVSLVAYSLKGSFDVLVVLPTVLGVFLGGIAGAAVMKKLSADALKLIFYGVMLLAGFGMLF